MLGYIAIDQYGDTIKLTNTKHPKKQLMKKLNVGYASKMYTDTKNNKTKHIGYIINNRWYQIYKIYEWFKEE
jgi:hypothetical protein